MWIYKKAINLLMTVTVILITVQIVDAQNWHSIGPSGMPVSTCLSSRYILIGTHQAGISRSIDNGLSWEYVKDMPPKAYGNLPSNVIMCIKHDPTNPDIVYAGTGPDETATGHGIYRSTDGGETWQAMNTGLPQWAAVPEISINPFHTNEVYINCRSNDGYSIYQSFNSGKTWNLFFKDQYLISTLIFDSQDSTLQYGVGTNGTVYQWKDRSYTKFVPSKDPFTYEPHPWTFLNPKTGSLFYANKTSLYKLKNDSDWVSLMSNLQATDVNITSISDADIDQQSGKIFICTDDGVFTSTDDGGHWNLTDAPANMKISIDSSEVVIVGFKGVYLSKDDGTEWNKISNGPKISSIYQTSMPSTATGSVIYAVGKDNSFSTQNVLFKTTNEGNTWSKLQLPNGVSPTVVRANPLNPDEVYVGCGQFFTGNLGLYKSNDGGVNWKQILPDSTTPVTAIEFFPQDTSRILLGLPGRILKSNNSGSSWEGLLQIVAARNVALEMNTVEVAPNNPNVVTAGISSNFADKGGFFITSDSENTWDRRVNGLSIDLDHTNITAIAISPKNDSLIYIGNSAGVYVSSDMGNQWRQCLSSDFTNGGIVEDIKIDKDNPNVIFVTEKGNDIGEGGLFFSGDAGKTWKEYKFPDINDHSRTSINILRYGEKYKVYIGTISYGLYKGTFPGTVLPVKQQNQIVNSYTLNQNYPNPFNPTTIINYTIPKAGFVTIIVYDIEGREIRTLVNEEEQPGNYHVRFNARDLSSGLYFYRMICGNYTDTKKMIVLK